MKLICHIGTPKTATTYLQKTLRMNSDWLHERGIIYPEILSDPHDHISLFYASALTVHPFLIDFGLKNAADLDAYRQRLKKDLRAKIATSDAHTMVLSSENLTGNLNKIEEISRLKNLFGDLFEEITIVVYLRRQDDAMVSMYAEFQRRGFSGGTFDTFAKNTLRSKNAPYLYYRRLLKKWVDVFGIEALTVRIFDKKRLLDGSILKDFLAISLNQKNPDLAGIQREKSTNSSLSAPAIEFLRRLHPYIPDRKNNKINPRREALIEKIEALPTNPPPALSRTQSRQIMRQYSHGNEWLKETFFPDDPRPLFPEHSDLTEESNINQITVDQFAEFAGLFLE